VHGAAERAGAGERVQVPVGDRGAGRVVPRREARAQRGRERDRGLAHVERAEDAVGDEPLVGHARLGGERVAEEADADVGVLVPGARVARELVVGEEGEQARAVVVGVRVGGVRGREVVGEARQAGVLSGEVGEGDPPPAAGQDHGA